MYLKNICFTLAAFFLVFLTSCAPQVEDLNNEAIPQGQEVVSTYTFHALIPGTLDNVSQMDLTLFSDGTSEAVRSVIPFDPDLNYSDYQLVGANESIEMGSELQVHFTEKTWFVPFDKQVGASTVLETEGHISINCYCSGAGNCNAKTTFFTDGSYSAECVSRDCSDNCNGEFTHATNGAIVSIPGVLVGTSSVSVN